MKLDICFSPALFPYYYDGKKETIAVVVDVFRASATICYAFSSGVSSIRPVASVEEAIAAKKRGILVGAERNAEKCSFADFGNSPFDYTQEKVSGKDIVFTTTNGTQTIKAVSEASNIIIGAFSNISAVAAYCLSRNCDVIICCAGWNNRFCLEDTLFGGALIEKLLSQKDFQSDSDALNLALKIWKEAKNDVYASLEKSEHVRRMLRLGLKKED
ncbi:MAG: 2-phosphosulfolactate phosphatase, partial [Prevotellaceae bacterium]|nr:2-phosphosulfolactate phosphatase [Prevotellaceae bacterium]